ncbi:TPA: ABC-three component system middle component 1 [Citrobacter freundii]
MNKDLFNIITQLLLELELNAGMFSLAENSITTLESKNLMLVRKASMGDYFLLAEIQASELHLVNRDLQTSLMSQLNSLLSDTGVVDLQFLNGVSKLKIDNHFEKNTTLLLFMKKTDDINKLLTKITEIEEDEYFFKKQVVLFSDDFLSNLVSQVTKSTSCKITTYLQNSMNNTDKFKEFITNPNNNTDYAGCAQLFEKLPFLHLNISSSGSNSLQNMIDNGFLLNTKRYSIRNNNVQNNDDSTSQDIVKNLDEIVLAALKYSSEIEKTSGNLDVETLLINLQGN